MLHFIMGALGVTGVTIGVLALLLRFGLLGAFIPAMIVNAIGIIIETFFRAVAWMGENFAVGEKNIFTSWQGVFAQFLLVLVLMAWTHWRYDHIEAVWNWVPWHHAAQIGTSYTESRIVPEVVPVKHSFFHKKERQPVVYRKRTASTADATGSTLRHQLGD